MRKIVTSSFVSAALILSAPLAASAATEDGGYGPPPPPESSLAGSWAVAECDSDVPWIHYSIVLTGQSEASSPARLVLSRGAESVSVALGSVVDGRLSGRVLWPGASVDGSGAPTSYPGWVREDGDWVATDGNFAWTREDTTAQIVVNPDLVVPLSYPPSTAECRTAPVGALAAADLPTTGGSVPTLLLAGAAGLIAAGAVGLHFARRRRS